MEISMIKSGIRKLRENAQVAYIGSVNEEGFPQIKGMLVLEHESMQTHYFSTNTSSKRVAQFLKIPGLPYTMWTIPKISIGARSYGNHGGLHRSRNQGFSLAGRV